MISTREDKATVYHCIDVDEKDPVACTRGPIRPDLEDLHHTAYPVRLIAKLWSPSSFTWSGQNVEAMHCKGHGTSPGALRRVHQY